MLANRFPMDSPAGKIPSVDLDCGLSENGIFVREMRDS